MSVCTYIPDSVLAQTEQQQHAAALREFVVILLEVLRTQSTDALCNASLYSKMCVAIRGWIGAFDADSMHQALLTEPIPHEDNENADVYHFLDLVGEYGDASNIGANFDKLTLTQQTTVENAIKDMIQPYRIWQRANIV